MTFLLESGYAFWNPLIWIIVFIVIMIVVYFFRRRGQKGYKKDTGQTRIFLCGEEVPEAEQRHIVHRPVELALELVEEDRCQRARLEGVVGGALRAASVRLPAGTLDGPTQLALERPSSGSRRGCGSWPFVPRRRREQ